MTADRCPDCGHLIAAHFADGGVFRGRCPTTWEALAWSSRASGPRVCVREFCRGTRKGEPVVCWPDHRDGDGVLIYLPQGDTWGILPILEIERTTKQPERRIVEGVIEAIEYALGIKGVRALRNLRRARTGGSDNA